MNTLDILKNRRSYRDLDDKIKVSDEKISQVLEEVTELVPDAFNMKSQRIILVQGDLHKKLWDIIYDAFDGMVKKEKTDGFKKASGTILFYYDKALVERMKEKFPLYKDQFEPWAHQSNGMLQISMWNALDELGLGVNLQHYNPVIDEKLRDMFGLSEDYVLLAQMVYGNILSKPDEKEKEDIGKRFRIER
ncbi:MAG: nitroreductase family protein [Anaerococcus sp.]|nr:nitroreductase family protein [Anaerococcus sp.]